jgi:hypothetical protein
LVIENLLLVIGRRFPDSSRGPGFLAALAVAMDFPRESLGRHADIVYMTDDKFSMTNFQSLKPFSRQTSAKKMKCT